MNIWKDWKAKLESAYSFMLKYSKITPCPYWSRVNVFYISDNLGVTTVTPVIPLVTPLRLQYIVSCKVKEDEGKICVDSFLERCCYCFKSGRPKAFSIDFVFTVKTQLK